MLLTYSLHNITGHLSILKANAEIIFDVEMVGLPGKEPELIELIGDN